MELASSAAAMDEMPSGALRFSINYGETKDMKIGEHIKFPPFAVGGYDFLMLYFPRGYRDKDKAAYASLCLCLAGPHAAGDDVAVAVDICLLDKLSGRPAAAWKRGVHTFASNKLDSPENGGAFGGFPFLIKKSELKRYLRGDGCFVALCLISVLSAGGPSYYTLQATPSRLNDDYSEPATLGDDLRRLWETRQLSDVAFKVKGESFPAHRLVLAARSPVFKAELFGGELAADHSGAVDVDDIDAEVFKAMLYFMYNDSLPEDEDLSVQLFQRLLAAAHRYAVEPLKAVCEEKLCARLSAETVAATMVLAYELGSRRLKEACLLYAGARDNYVEVALSDGYKSLLMSSKGPAIVQELRARLVGGSSPAPPLSESSSMDK